MRQSFAKEFLLWSPCEFFKVWASAYLRDKLYRPGPKLAPWLPDDSLFVWNTWDQVETHTHRAQTEKGEISPLGAISVVSALTMYLKRENPAHL